MPAEIVEHSDGNHRIKSAYDANGDKGSWQSTRNRGTVSYEPQCKASTVPRPSAKRTSTKDAIERSRSHEKSGMRRSENPLLKINKTANQTADRHGSENGGRSSFARGGLTFFG